MRCRLLVLPTDVALANVVESDLSEWAGKPVRLGQDERAPVVGRVKRAWLEGREVWGDLELDRAALPHELFTMPPVSIARVRKVDPRVNCLCGRQLGACTCEWTQL